MKKFLFLVAFIATTLGVSAQTTGDFSVLGNIGYQSSYERFTLGVQGRYNLTDNIRLAPDVMFFFPKDKVTGLDVNLNAHYVFRFPGERFSVYPLVGIGMQNNFYGKDSDANPKDKAYTKTKLAFNLGGGISYNVTERGFLNAEIKFMFGDDDSAVFLLGYGYRF